jgi:glycosyltransferase involved in cell wall biosynthesis
VWEAMSLGIVVLSAPAGDLRLEIKNNINGFLINEYDMYSFCKKLNWIIKNHHKLNKLRKNAILSMKQKHDIKNISSQILNNFF